MPVDLGTKLLVTWRDRIGESQVVLGTVSEWYSRRFAWGTLTGAMLHLEKPIKVRGTRLGPDGDLGQPGVSPAGSHLLLVARQTGSPWADFGPVQVELRPDDPSVQDQPGWWLSGDGDYEVRPGAGWSRLVWRRVLTLAAVLFGVGAIVAAVAGGGALRHLSFPGTPAWPQASVAALIGGSIGALALAVTVRALWAPRVHHRAQLQIGLMIIGAFVLLMFGVFIATYGDPA